MEGIVFVRGNIELKSGDHIVKELIAFADEYEMIAEKIIDGDLIVTENDKLEPYIIYCASKDVIMRRFHQLFTES